MGVLIALLQPAVQAAREAGRRTVCASTMRQLGLALHHLHDHLRRFPAGWSGVATGHVPAEAADESPDWAWSAHLLPQIEEQATFDTIDFRRPVYDPANQALHEVVRTRVVQFVRGDAGVRFIADHIDLEVLRGLCTRAGGAVEARLP